MRTLSAHTIGRREERKTGDLCGVRILVVMVSIPVQGMERANLQIFKMMRERGAEVLFVTEQTHGARVRREVERIGCRWAMTPFMTSFGERLHLTKNPGEMAVVVRAWAKAAWNLRRIHKEYQPTHVHLTNLSSFLYSLPALRRAGQSIVFRLPNPPDLNLSGYKKKLHLWIWRRCVSTLCDVIVCNSRFALSVLQDVGVAAYKTRVIPNCLAERVCAGKSDAPVVKSDRFNVIYLGRIRPQKGVKELFDAALRMTADRRDVDFYFAGEYHWKNPFAEGLIREVETRNLGSRIQFTGEIEDIFGLLRQCHLHVCPSVSAGESFPNVVLEAKSQGLPSVVFPTAGLAEAVTHLVDGYVCSEKSARELYDGIRYFLEDAGALKEAGEAARQSLEKFSRERVAEEWAALFKHGTE